MLYLIVRLMQPRSKIRKANPKPVAQFITNIFFTPLSVDLYFHTYHPICPFCGDMTSFTSCLPQGSLPSLKLFLHTK